MFTRDMRSSFFAKFRVTPVEIVGVSYLRVADGHKGNVDK